MIKLPKIKSIMSISEFQEFIDNTLDLFIPVYEYLRNNHPNVGRIYSDNSGNFIYFQIN